MLRATDATSLTHPMTQNSRRPIAIPPNAALLLIDVQRGFEPSSWGYWAPPGGSRNNPGAERVIARLLGAWRAYELPVLHVKHDPVNRRSPLRTRSAGNEISAFAQPIGDEPVYRKRVNSAFIGTTLERDLRTRRVDTLVVAGLTTDHCVSTSVRMASNLGFTTLLVSDATATFDRVGPDGELYPAESIHRTALASLHEEFAIVVTADMVFRGLAQDDDVLLAG